MASPASDPRQGSAHLTLSAPTGYRPRAPRPVRSPVIKPLPPRRFVVHTEPGDLEQTAEMRWDAVRADEYLTPPDGFFVRSHGRTPLIDPRRWRLRIEGPGVRQPVEITLDDLLEMPSVSMVKALECAGNGREVLEDVHGRRAGGARWGLGAIGVAEWTGVPLRLLLEQAGVRPSAVQAVPEGLDGMRVRRPLPLHKAADDAIVAYAMNDQPLPPDHGFPARLLVPGWAAVASIKWLGRIVVTEEPVRTYWNTARYVLTGPPYAPANGAPGVVIEDQVVKSAFELARPARLPAGPVRLTGRSWSSDAAIARVEVRVNDEPWRDAELHEPNHPGAWVRWSFEWKAMPGQHELRARATDNRGRVQPDQVPWNDGGYLNGAVVTHPVRVSTGG